MYMAYSLIRLVNFVNSCPMMRKCCLHSDLNAFFRIFSLIVTSRPIVNDENSTPIPIEQNTRNQLKTDRNKNR